MRITNKFNLPEAFLKLVQESQYKPKSNSYSVTALLQDDRELLLNKRHDDEIERDASEMVNLVLGTATHSLIEKFDKTGFAEMYLSQEVIPGFNLTGKCDLYDKENYTLVDYKTATVWKIQFQDFEDWKKQGLMYAWLLSKKQYYVGTLKFHAILKDWTAREKRLKGDDYLECPVYTWEYKVTTKDMEEIEEFILKRFLELKKNELLGDDDLPDCKDTWYTGDKYAVTKNESSRAYRVLDTLEEAQNFRDNKYPDAIIVHREGEHRKCQDYCNCCKYCKYYIERRVK